MCCQTPLGALLLRASTIRELPKACYHHDLDDDGNEVLICGIYCYPVENNRTNEKSVSCVYALFKDERIPVLWCCDVHRIVDFNRPL